MNPSRRALMFGALCGCLRCAVPPAAAKTLTLQLQAAVGQGYRPIDADERGLWQSCEKFEEELASSKLVMEAPELRDYTREVLTRLLGPLSADVRIYLVHNAEFNASMTPNGMMMVHSGLLIRARSEDQFAAVLGHECGHYLRRHNIQSFRDRSDKKSLMAFVTAGATVAAGAAYQNGYNGGSWIDLANSINNSIVLSIFSFSREQETEADAYGIQLIRDAGYAPGTAAQVWEQLISERKASAVARSKKYKDGSASAFSTHPPSETRMGDLRDTAIQMLNGSNSAPIVAKEKWDRVLRPYWPSLLDEQVKLNDPGAALYLLRTMADGGTSSGVLKFYEGEVLRLRDEPGDAQKAAEAYAAAVVLDDAPPEAWRAHGYALIKSDRKDDGKAAMARYLELRPDAADVAMIRFTIQN